jgi:hypothetical protein
MDDGAFHGLQIPAGIIFGLKGRDFDLNSSALIEDVEREVLRTLMRNIAPGTTLSQPVILALSVSDGSPSVVGGDCNFKGSARTKFFLPVFVYS